ncbi:glycosyltransferase family 2 protein [Synechococcus sp. CS-1332]|uniref:glycosyltransferase family 2 protein n=1 Tax=Synechococcus sp. CS-1332 TaxID=2847972 RepID=UPI00223A82B7|nr:glycosyltransferase family 2 protein [Synechococcus sp. CS-1332]MCT0209012.1 glycosyltransferase [Synechococcus sp. CS-1332]
MVPSVDVSVVIPCFNSRDYVGEAIRSVHSSHGLSIEVIVVDDGSTDGSLEELNRLREAEFPFLKILSHPGHVNFGASSSRCLGFHASTGRYLAFLDADDIFMLDKIDIQVKTMDQHPDVVLCHAGVHVIGDVDKAAFFESIFSRNPTHPYRLRRQRDYLIRNNICNSSVVVRSSALKGIPFSYVQLAQYEDWLCWSLLAAKGYFIYLDQPLVGYRVHGHSATSSMVKGKLRHLYALLEYKLVLLARSESGIHALRVLFSLLETIRLLLVEYLWDPMELAGKSSGVRKNLVVWFVIGGAKVIRKCWSPAARESRA